MDAVSSIRAPRVGIRVDWRITPLRLAASLISLAIALRLINLGSRPLWLDEAFSAWFSDQSFHYLWTVLPTYEAHPPFYYSLLKCWRSMVGESHAAMRGLSVLFGTLTVPVIMDRPHASDCGIGRIAMAESRDRNEARSAPKTAELVFGDIAMIPHARQGFGMKHLREQRRDSADHHASRQPEVAWPDRGQHRPEAAASAQSMGRLAALSMALSRIGAVYFARCAACAWLPGRDTDRIPRHRWRLHPCASHGFSLLLLSPGGRRLPQHAVSALHNETMVLRMAECK